MTDQETVEKLINGDDTTIKEFFFERCRPMLTYIGSSYFPNKQSADELIGELYKLLSQDNWKKLRQFQYSCSLNSYVTIIASRYFQRKRDIHPALPLDESIQIEKPLPHTDLTVGDRTTFKKDLAAILNRLKPFDRFLVQRILIDGERSKDILQEAKEMMACDTELRTEAGSDTKFAAYLYTRYNRVKNFIKNEMITLGYGY